MAEPNQDPEHDSRIVAHIGHIPENVRLEDSHFHRLQRDRRWRNVKWMAITVVLALLAVALVLLFSGMWKEFQTYAPGYEPKDQSRQQYLEQTEPGRQKEAP